MPRYLVYSAGLLYDDVTLPSDADALVRACRVADERLGAPAASYRPVSRDDPEVEYLVYYVLPGVPDDALPSLEDDCKFFGAVAVERDPLQAPTKSPIYPSEAPRAASPLPGLGLPVVPRTRPPAPRQGVVTARSYPALFLVLDTIAENQGRQAGGYAAPGAGADLESAERAAQGLSTDDLQALVSGGPDDRSVVASRSADAAALVRVRDAFAAGR